MASLWPLPRGAAASVSQKFLFSRAEPAKKFPEFPELPAAAGAGSDGGRASRDA